MADDRWLSVNEIALYLQEQFSKLSGEIAFDESYLGGMRKVIRGSGSQGKRKHYGTHRKIVEMRA